MSTASVGESGPLQMSAWSTLGLLSSQLPCSALATSLSRHRDFDVRRNPFSTSSPQPVLNNWHSAASSGRFEEHDKNACASSPTKSGANTSSHTNQRRLCSGSSYGVPGKTNQGREQAPPVHTDDGGTSKNTRECENIQTAPAARHEPFASPVPETQALERKDRGLEIDASGPGAPDASGPRDQLVSRYRRLLVENRQLKRRQLCRQCEQTAVNTTLLPCGHLLYCQDCADTLTHCGLCQREILADVKTFLC